VTRVEDVTFWTLGFTAAALAVLLLDVGPPVQPVVMAAFLLFVPGAAVLGGAPTWSWLLWLTSVMACSLSMAVLTATALLLAGWWTPDRVLAVLVLTSLVSSASYHLRLRAGQLS
jgi:hypothetical protein